jgi:uncharacterized membrane protein
MKPNKYKTITVALMLAGLTWTSAYADVKPAEAAKPAETKPADAKPAEAAKPAETKPAETKPADAKPAEAAKPAETKPADAKPAEAAKPVEEVKKGKKGVVEEGLKICNKTSVELSAVIAYSTDDADKQWVSQGWTDIKAGECEMALSEKLTKHYYYVFATSDNGDVSIGGDNVNHAFCVDTGEDDNFKIDGNKCATKDKKKFIEVEVKAALQSFDLKLK